MSPRHASVLVLLVLLLAACGGTTTPTGRTPLPPTDAQVARLAALGLPASIGPAGAEVVFAVPVLPVVLETDGTATALTSARTGAARIALEDAAARIAEWSEGRHTVRFELRVIDVAVPLAIDGTVNRWPDPDVLAPLVETAFPGGADGVLVIAPPTRVIDAPAALAAPRRFFGRDVAYLSIPARLVSVNDRHPGEIVVHEFGHALELWSHAAGEVRPALHDPRRYGFTADDEDSYEAWYRFYFTHETRAVADAARRDARLPATGVAPDDRGR